MHPHRDWLPIILTLFNMRPHPRYPHTSNTNNNNNLCLRYLSHTQPFLDTDTRPTCHIIMPRQTSTSFISDMTRHPSWPRLISHISARLSSYATFMVKNQTQAHIMALI